jgi:protease-4
MDPLDATERAILQKFVDDTYDAFVNVVADGRDKSYEEVDRIGGGRVWAGTDAVEVGLVDVFGGLEKSIEIAAEMAGLENYRLQSLPVLDDPLTALMRELTGGAMARTQRTLQRELGDHYVHYKNLREIQEISGVQAIMPFEIEVE